MFLVGPPYKSDCKGGKGNLTWREETKGHHIVLYVKLEKV